MITLIFDTFNIPSFYVGIQTVLSLYSSERVTSVVFDTDDRVRYSVQFIKAIEFHKQF